MNSQDPLARLLKAAAAAAPKKETAAAAFALEARALAAWRTADQAGESFVVWLRRAAICACLLALMCLAWNFRELAGGGQGGDELVVADAAMRIGVEP